MFDDQYVDCLAKNYPEIELMNINNVNSYTDSLTLTIYIYILFSHLSIQVLVHILGKDQIARLLA